MDYSKMSDLEINKLVLDKVSNKKPEEWLEPYALFEPCSNPADAWPIIIDNRISLLSVECLNGDISWLAKNKACPSRGDKNPLRAAMIVFLKMQESANVQDNPSR